MDYGFLGINSVPSEMGLWALLPSSASVSLLPGALGM